MCIRDRREYFIKYVDLLGEDFALRVEKNPLRILDTKDPAWIEIAKNAPQILDFLSEQSITDFEVIKESLTNLGIPFEVIPTLVRGFDYYTNTTFEFISSSIDAAQGTICAGGRYNKLVKEMGGEETPGIGFGLGIERLLMVIEAEKLEIRTRILDVFIVDLINSFESKNYFQNINSVFEEEISLKQMKKYINLFLKPDKLFIFDIDQDTRAKHLIDRGYSARDNFDEEYRKKWEKVEKLISL